MTTPWYVKARQLMKSNQPPIQNKDVADALGVTASAAGHYLKGRRTPSVEQVQVIAGLLGVSMSELVGEDPYFITDKKERALIDRSRDLAEDDFDELLEFIEMKRRRRGLLEHPK